MAKPPAVRKQSARIPFADRDSQSCSITNDRRWRRSGAVFDGLRTRSSTSKNTTFRSGDTVSVGVGGLTQAGGFGWMIRKHGLAIDDLLAAEVVTAAGEVVRATATENGDLFWALRGGAGNFGVVTALEFQAQPVTAVRYGSIAFALDDLDQLLKGWNAAMRSAPDELPTTVALMPALGPFPAFHSVPRVLPQDRRSTPDLP